MPAKCLLKRLTDDAHSVALSRPFHTLMTCSSKKCCRKSSLAHLAPCAIGVKTLRTQDTSDPRHFGPIRLVPNCPTFRHYQTGAEESGQFGTSAEVSFGHFGTGAELSRP